MLQKLAPPIDESVVRDRRRGDSPVGVSLSRERLGGKEERRLTTLALLQAPGIKLDERREKGQQGARSNITK